MTWPMTLVLVRHAESEGNVLTVAERAAHPVGTHDYDLTPRGRRQAEITGAYLAEHFPQIDVRYVSYYRRARETMRIIQPDARVYEDPRLREAERGIWHVLTPEQVMDQCPFELERKEREGLYHYRPIGGENWPDVELREHSFLGTLARDCGGQIVLIVVHGHWLVLFRKLIEHLTIEQALDLYKNHNVENASVTVYRSYEDHGRSRLKLDQLNIVPWAGKV